MSDFLQRLAQQVNQANQNQQASNQPAPTNDWLSLLTELQEVILPSHNQTVRVRSLSLQEDFSLTANDLVSVPGILKTVLEVVWNALQDKDYFQNSFETFLRRTILSKDIQVLALGILQATYEKVISFGSCNKCNTFEAFDLPVKDITISKFEPKVVNFDEKFTISLQAGKVNLNFEVKYPSTADILQNFIYLSKINDPAALVVDEADIVRKILLADLYLKNLHRVFARVITRFTVVDNQGNLLVDVSRPNDIYLTTQQAFNQYHTFITELSKLPIKLEGQLLKEIDKVLDEPIVEFSAPKLPCKECPDDKAEIIVEPLFFLYFKVFIQSAE